MNIQSSVHVLIMRDDHLLIIIRPEDGGEWFEPPYAEQHFGETLTQAMRRACLAEIGVNVEVGELLTVREYIGTNHEYAVQDKGFHIVSHLFAARVPKDYKPPTGARWQPIRTLETIPFYPQALGKLLARGETIPAYMGDVN